MVHEMKSFKGVIPYKGFRGHPGHVTRHILTNFRSYIIRYLSLIDPVVSEEYMFENVDGRTLESLVYFKLIHEPSA